MTKRVKIYRYHPEFDSAAEGVVGGRGKNNIRAEN